jgi:U8 snoRNA-decapping enzyme
VYTLIETGKRHSKLADMVFVALHCAESIPYRNYTHVPKKERGKKIPLVLMLMRWDGCIGFPGGNVDPGEDLSGAVLREAMEEINYDLDPVRVRPLCSFAPEGKEPAMHIHCFECPITQDEMVAAISGAPLAEHFLAETQGCFAVQVARFKGGVGIDDYLKHNFKATAKMELEALIKKHGWITS